MPSYDTFAEIRLDVLDRASEETGANESEFYAFVARALDRAYHDLLTRRAWLFSRARRPLILQAPAPITTTITWSAAAYTATLGAAQATSLIGWRVRHPTRQEVYRITAHAPGAAAITLEAPLQGTALSAASVTLFKDEYDLSEIQAPPTAPTVALAGTGAGNVDDGAHSYRVTFVSANGETEGGATAAVTVADKTVNGKVSVTAIPLGPLGTLSRKLYRTKAAAAIYYELTTLADNTTASYTDNTADSSLGAAESPVINTTCSVRHITGMWVADANRQIDGPFTEERLREEYGVLPTSSWPPRAYARISETQVRFSHYPSQAGLIEVPHSFIPRDLSVCHQWENVVPRNWRWLLSDGGLFWVYSIKNDARAATAGARWEKGIADLAVEDDIKRIGLEGSRDRTRKEPPW